MRAVTLLALLGAGTAQAEERLSVEGLRQRCSAWRADGPATQTQAVYALALSGRLPPLRYSEGELQLTLSTALPIGDGARGTADLMPDEDEDLFAAVPAETAARLLRAQSQGKLQATIFFRMVPGRLTSTPCLLIAGGRHTRVRVQPLGAELTAPGEPPLRLLSEQGGPLLSQGPAQLRFDARALIYEGEPQDRELVAEALRTLEPRAQACHKKALERRPDLLGALVLGVDLDREGRPSGSRVEVDAVGDEPLGRCLREALGELRPARLRRPGHASLTVQLQRGGR